MVLSFLQVFTQRCSPWFNTPALHAHVVPLLKSLFQQLLAYLQASCDRESKKGAASRCAARGHISKQPDKHGAEVAKIKGQEVHRFRGA